MKVGLIARMDRTGLGQGQTLRLARLLDLNCIMLINSQPFNGNEQHPEWYSGYFTHVIDGFPTDDQVREFLKHLDVVISCETFYNNAFTRIAQQMNVKTILIANYEFFDWFREGFRTIPLPDKIIMPSLWHMDEMAENYGAEYVPTPLFDDEFTEVREKNLSRKISKPRYLFNQGRQAIHDRNGLMTMYDALKYTNADFELVVKAQGETPKTDDPRVSYDFSEIDKTADLYDGFDAMIMPRRYAGQCLPMTEALTCGLPVIMTDVDPNNKILPPEWLIPVQEMGTFMTRKPIEIYSGDPKALAALLDNFTPDKQQAIALSKLYSSDIIRADLERIISAL